MRELLSHTQDVLFAAETFDPARSTREFRVGLSNEVELLLLPPLLARLLREAEGVRLMVKVASRSVLLTMLDEGVVDLAIGCLDTLPTWHRHEMLYAETHLCCFNPKLILARPPINLADYLALPHALMSMKNSLFGCLEDALARAGAQVNAVAAAPHLTALLAAVTDAPLLTTLPARIVERYAPQFKLATSPVPLPLEAFPVRMVWHARFDREPGVRWLASLIQELAGEW